MVMFNFPKLAAVTMATTEITLREMLQQDLFLLVS